MGVLDVQFMLVEMVEEFIKEIFEDDFIDYVKKGYMVEYMGDQEVDGVICYEVKFIKEDGMEEFYYFDFEYMVLIMQKIIISSG